MDNLTLDNREKRETYYENSLFIQKVGNLDNHNTKSKLQENNILIVGKMRAWKSSLIKLLTKKAPKIDSGVDPVTERPDIYEGELNKVKFNCIDTPGLSESNDKDIFHLSELKSFMVDNKLVIKHIIIFINFHEQSFSQEFQEELTAMAVFFPMPTLWEHITLCYTHCNPQKHKSVSKIIKENYPSLKKNFDNIIDKFTLFKINKIDYDNIKKIYVDIIFPDDQEDIKKDNNETFKELEEHLKVIFGENSLYSYFKTKTEKMEYAKIVENCPQKDIICTNEIEVTEYYDINDKLISKSYRIIGNEEIVDIKNKNKWKKRIIGGKISTAILGLAILALQYWL